MTQQLYRKDITPVQLVAGEDAEVYQLVVVTGMGLTQEYIVSYFRVRGMARFLGSSAGRMRQVVRYANGHVRELEDWDRPLSVFIPDSSGDTYFRLNPGGSNLIASPEPSVDAVAPEAYRRHLESRTEGPWSVLEFYWSS